MPAELDIFCQSTFKPTAVTKFQGTPQRRALNVREWGNVANIA